MLNLNQQLFQQSNSLSEQCYATMSFFHILILFLCLTDVHVFLKFVKCYEIQGCGHS